MRYSCVCHSIVKDQEAFADHLVSKHHWQKATAESFSGRYFEPLSNDEVTLRKAVKDFGPAPVEADADKR